MITCYLRYQVPLGKVAEFEAYAAMWLDLVPRFGASYNLFGDGRTALKLSLGRYVGKEAVTIANGLDATTPTVAVINATRPDETIVVATLAEIGDRLDQLPAEGPAIVVIGQVLHGLNLRAQADDQSTSPQAERCYRPPLRMISP